MTVADLLAAVGLLGAGAGILFAARQLQLSQRVAREEFLLRLFELLQRYNHLHLRLETGEWSHTTPEAEWMELNRYMGLIEHLKFLVDDGILSIRTVDRSFSHRVYAIVSNPVIVRRNLEDRQQTWKDFITLWRALEAEPSFRAHAALAQARTPSAPNTQ